MRAEPALSPPAAATPAQPPPGPPARGPVATPIRSQPGPPPPGIARQVGLALLGLTVLGAGRLGRALVVALLLAGGLLLMRATAPPVPSIAASPDAPAPRTVERAEGLVLRVEPGATSVLPEGELGNVPGGGRGTVLTLRVTSGSQQGREVQVTLPAGQLATSAASAAGYQQGDRVVLSYQPQLDGDAQARPADGGAGAPLQGLREEEPFRVTDHVRWPWLLWGTVAFAFAIGAVAGWMGLRALTGLTFAVFVLWWFVIPRLLAGQPPVAVALVGCALIAVPAILLTHGPRREGLVPLAGMAGSLALVGALAASVVGLARLSGLASSEEISLVYVGTQGAVDPQGLLLAGMLIGVLGGLVDVTVGQSAAVFEFHDADPGASRRVLYRRGMNVGRAHVAATVHTLVLAYAGAALPVLLLFAMYASALGDIWNREMIVVEVVRALAGSIGLAAAMPLTTLLAALTCRPALGKERV
ncbi:MAG TPA: YibE/F family protein [Chloroflexota bacterium]|nr:YibE/F family protein [Chloroflexota bacterium]